MPWTAYQIRIVYEILEDMCQSREKSPNKAHNPIWILNILPAEIKALKSK